MIILLVSTPIARERLRRCAALLLCTWILAAPYVLAALSSAVAGDPSLPNSVSEQENNLVMGVGLVIGLPDTGDAAVDHSFVDKSIVGVLRRAGLDLWRGQIKPGRVAKVIVTAELPTDAADGKRVAVSVTAIGDATSLAGGSLLATPLRSADGTVYAVSQGQVEIGNQIAGAELSQQPEITARIGRLAEGTVLDADHPQTATTD